MHDSTLSADDTISIRALADRYSAAACRRDPAAMAAVYASDGVLIAFGNVITGRPAIEEAFVHTCRTFEVINQICSGAEIAVAGDTATSRFNVTELVRKPGAEYLDVFMGDYADELVRRDGEWFYARRTLTRRAQARLSAAFRI